MPRKSKVREFCNRCGKPALPKRATCSDKCAAVVLHAGRDSREDRTCPVCAEGFRAYPNAPQVCCSSSCAGALRKAAAVARTYAHTCTHCGVRFRSKERHRVYCGSACASAHASHYGQRSVPRRAARRRAHARAYRRKDKAAVLSALVRAQGGVCDICGEGGTEKTRLVLDHCVHTGEPRAALCVRCNVAVGMVLESAYIAERLVLYVRACERFKAHVGK